MNKRTVNIPALSIPPLKAHRSQRPRPVARNHDQIPRALGEADLHLAVKPLQGVVRARLIIIIIIIITLTICFVVV